MASIKQKSCGRKGSTGLSNVNAHFKGHPDTTCYAGGERHFPILFGFGAAIKLTAFCLQYATI
jgi:hypothetical protein